MSQLANIITLIISLAALVKGADYFVDSASRIAKRFKVSEFLIGLTLVSIGTSLPELGAAISASLKNNSEIILGNIVGSNIANIAIVLASAIAFNNIVVHWKKFHTKIAMHLILATFLFAAIVMTKIITFFHGIIFLVFFIVILYLWKDDKDFFLKTTEHHATKKERKEIKLYKEFAIFISAGILIFIGAKYLIPSVTGIAQALGIKEVVISLFIIALGTSLPELAVSITSAKKKNEGILIGNIVGSNIANLMLIGGVSAIINPIRIDPVTFFYSIPTMIFLTLILAYMMMHHEKIKKIHGYALMVFYIVFIAALFIIQSQF